MHVQKLVHDLTLPGTTVLAAGGPSTEVGALLTLATQAFFHANAALWRFQDEYAAMLDADFERRPWEDAARDRERWLALYAALSARSGTPWDPALHRQATHTLRQEKWADGHPPRAFVRAYPLITAEVVLAALDDVGTCLRRLAAHPDVPGAAQRAAARFDAEFPQVLAARSAVLTPEDRVDALLARPSGLGSGMGSRLAGGHLDFTTLVFTTADGRVHGLDVTDRTLQGVQALLQDVLDHCAWTGPATIEPN